MKHIERIVVGTDFSEIAERAVDEAMDFAALVGASVILVHAYEFPVLSLPDGVATPTFDFAKTLADNALKGLAASLERQKGRSSPVRTLLRMGAPWVELNSVADEQHADLIVVGTHGRRGVSRALMGSVAERVVRTATRPVLVVRAQPDS